MKNYIEKYKIKDEGLRLEKQQPHKAIVFYKNLLNHKYFVNDFWPYRRLVLTYKKTKEFDKKTDIIRAFFKSGVYCNNHQFLWFSNKLKILSEKGFITNKELVDLINYFKTHSLINRKKANTPVPIADRIRKSHGEIIVVNEQKYEEKQKQYEYEVRCSELNRQKKYNEYIELLNHMIDDLRYRRYDYFKKLCIAYRRIGDKDNELRIINKYFNGESTRTKISDRWFKKRLNEVENLKKKCEISFKKDEIDIDKTPIFEFDKTLDEYENLKRKNMLIQFSKALTKNNRHNDAILFYKYLCNNTYFSNDWYPYRQLTILFDEIGDYNANIVNIKKLLHSKIFLNRYQFIWFSEKLRQLIENNNVDEYQVQKWIEYYESHGALNKNKLNKFLADKFVETDDKITIMSDESFEYNQERCALKETGCIYERVGNHELAVNHYMNIIRQKEFNFYEFYQRACICLEKQNDYKQELKVIKLYYSTPPIDRNEKSDEWFEKRLKNVNEKL